MDSTTGLSFNLNLHPSADEIRLPDQQITNPEGGDSNLMEAISRIDRESKRMTEMVTSMFDKCSEMHNQLMDLIMINSNHGELDDHSHMKRKSGHLDDDNQLDNNDFHLSDLSCVNDGNCCKRIRMINCKPKITTTFIRVDPDDPSLAVKDGYQWRKYGQKVTRDNPSPRAYFKCSFAPICPVKKKVQKSVEDPKVLVVTYEGEHNHKKAPSVGTLNITPSSTTTPAINLSPSSHMSSPSSSSLDRFFHQNLCDRNHKERGSDDEDNEDQPRSPLHHWLVEQMASSLTKDPSFTSTLAAAISDKVLQQTLC